MEYKVGNNTEISCEDEMKATTTDHNNLIKSKSLDSIQQIQFPFISIPLVILGLGVIFTVLLQVSIQYGVFYSGDGGLKALLAQQLASGEFHVDLTLPAATWVQDLWENGLYPYTSPYVYNESGQYYITFPFTFPLITAPFYALAGYRGLYVIPVVSTWLIWIKFYTICRRQNISQLMTSVVLIALIFASPLTFYSATYWEHTLAVALAFWGMATLLFPKTEKLSDQESVLGGILIGLSVWFRPEFLCLVSSLVLLILISKLIKFSKFRVLSRLNPAPGKSILFCSSLLLTVSAFFGLNNVIYGHPLGIHALQIVEQFSLKERILAATTNLNELIQSLFEYFPVLTGCLLLAVISLLHKKIRLTSQALKVYVIGLSFLLTVPLIIPLGAGGKQWGPRFLLILIPMVLLVAAKHFKLIEDTSNKILRFSCLAVFCVLLTLGIRLNSFAAPKNLQTAYGAIAPAIQALEQQPHPVVAMSHQFVGQVLEAPLPQKVFFRTETTEDLKRLGVALVKQGQPTFLYVCYPHEPCSTPEENPSNLGISVSEQRFQLKFSTLGTFGKYPLYEVSILETSTVN